jgi:hypothetical protein
MSSCILREMMDREISVLGDFETFLPELGTIPENRKESVTYGTALIHG